MSGIRVITPRGTVDVPIAIEVEGPDAVDAYVAAQLNERRHASLDARLDAQLGTEARDAAGSGAPPAPTFLEE